MNYLEPVSQVAARLAAAQSLPVRVAADIAQAQDFSVGQPEIWVLFLEDRTTDSAGDVTVLDFNVGVVYVAPGVLPDLAAAGDALTAITKALAGYEPPEHTGLAPFKRVGSMRPEAWPAQNLLAYGLIFETKGAL